MKMGKRLIVVMPAFNEADTVGPMIRSVRAVGEKLTADNLTLAIVVVDDGSIDDTRAAAEAAGADEVVSHRRQSGVGAAVRTALTVARDRGADIVVKLDADGQHDPNDIPALIAPILGDSADVVYGSRIEGITYRMPLIRRAGNKSFSWLMRTLTGWPVEDSQPGIFAVNSAYLRNFSLPGDYNYTQQLLLDAYHRGMRFAQAPVTFHRRAAGTSFVSLRYPFVVGLQILTMLASVRPMQVFAPIGAFFLAIAAIVFAVEFVIWLAGGLNRPIEHVNLVLGSFLFGVQTLFFGLLAQMIVNLRRLLVSDQDREVMSAERVELPDRGTEDDADPERGP
ncbi:MAG: glycosyltransferase family 2 protein [Alphaproteobacteria bacterium]|nr:glycosyltransferase family 2 protein [Alphaproteobacteria bacterium]